MASFVSGLMSGVGGGGKKGVPDDSQKKSLLKKMLDKARPKQMPKVGSSSGSGGEFIPGNPPDSFKKGGKVRKTKSYRLHKGERVLNAKQTKRYDRSRGRGKRR